MGLLKVLLKEHDHDNIQMVQLAAKPLLLQELKVCCACMRACVGLCPCLSVCLRVAIREHGNIQMVQPVAKPLLLQ